MHQQSIYDVLGAPARAAERFFHARGRWNVSGKTRSDIQDFSGYLAKLALSFNKEERSWFVDNFARHMKYRSNPGTFVIGIDDIVKWLEFTQKKSAIKLLLSRFEEGIDFSTALPSGKAVHMGGGHNKTEYLLSVRTTPHCEMAGIQAEGKSCATSHRAIQRRC